MLSGDSIRISAWEALSRCQSDAPDVHRLGGVAGYPDAPLDGGTRDGEVPQASSHPRKDLVAPCGGLHEVRIICQQLLRCSIRGSEDMLDKMPHDRPLNVWMTCHMWVLRRTAK